MFDAALRFLLDTIFGLITYSFLLRFAMQWLRAPFRNPLGQAVVALTDWAVKPVRRVVPGYKGIDGSTLVLAWVAEFAWLCALALLVGPGAFDGSGFTVTGAMTSLTGASGDVHRSCRNLASALEESVRGTTGGLQST